jgi:hypothetical protein
LADLSALYNPEEEQGLLALVLFPRFERMLNVVHTLVQSIFPELTPDDFRLDDTATRKMLALAAERVVLIDESTRAALREVLQEGQGRGYSDVQIADGVPAEGYRGIKGLYLETWKSRSELIARTELSTAQVASSLDRYEATGLVDQVQIVEHTDTDDECAARNGHPLPIGARPGLAHPRCRMSIVPIVRDAA